MRVAVDARWIFREISGVGSYTRELLAALAGLEDGHEYVVLFHDQGVMERTQAEAGLSRSARITARLVPWGVFSPAGQFGMPLLLRRLGIRVYHSPNYLVPLAAFPRERAGRIRAVVTVHDVIPLLFPQAAPRSRKARLFPLYRRLMAEIGRRADFIVSDSETSRRDCIARMRIPATREDRVVAVPLGVSARFTPGASAPATAAEGRTVLYVGRADPYKNLPVLVEAFAALCKSGLSGTRLVIAGSRDPRYPEAAALAQRLGIADRVRWTGYVTDDALLALYRQAAALVLPSAYEGFGLPALEAMACGTPVICSRIGALEELARDAAVYATPGDARDLALRIREVLAEPAAAARLAAAGPRRAGQLTWRRTAELTREIYLRADTLPGGEPL